MSDALPPLEDPSHASAWATAYLDGELSDADRAAFEEHMKSHAVCREHVETMRAALPELVRTLMEDGPPRTGAEYAEIAKAAEARLKAQQAAGSPRPALSPGRGEGGGRRWSWIFGAGFAGLTAAAASVLVFLQPFTAGLEPELMHRIEMAPLADGTAHPLWPAAVKLDVWARVRFGRLLLRAPRLPTDVYAAVVLVDSRGKKWLVQSGEQTDPHCVPACGPLELRVELDKLAPGAFSLALLVSPRTIAPPDLQDWLKDPLQPPSGWLGARGYAVVSVNR